MTFTCEKSERNRMVGGKRIDTVLSSARFENNVQFPECYVLENNYALSSVESRVFVDTINSDEANRARAFVIRRGGEGGLRI